MSIKLILFDLDGVLVDAKKIHYDTLNIALSEIGEEYVISTDEHEKVYDGLKTNEKLNILTQLKNLPIDKHKDIWKRKQELTLLYLDKIKEDERLVSVFKVLKERGYKIACCSNSIRISVEKMLSNIGLYNFFDKIISNEDVINSKPHPEMYWSVISELSLQPEEVLIIEDSPNGLLAAQRVTSNVLRVKNPLEVTIENITSVVDYFNENPIKYKWIGNGINILIPMAGAGSRFANVGYHLPKPLINVGEYPMIKKVTDNLNINGNYTYIVQGEHREKYNLDTILNLITPKCNIISVNGVTEGAACTTLYAENIIDNDTPLLIANSDQYLEWDSTEFMYHMIEGGYDGGIITFESDSPKWSYVKINELGYINEIAEKKVISNMATVGLYYWAKGSDYVKYAKRMIEKNIRVNNEFYVCPVYNEAILDNKRIKPYNVKKMWGLGTPEDLDFFLKNNK